MNIRNPRQRGLNRRPPAVAKQPATVYHAVWPCGSRCFVGELDLVMRSMGLSDDYVIYEAAPDCEVSYDEVMKIKTGAAQ